MRIVIVVRILWTAGAPKKAINEARALTSIGHDVRVVFLRRSARVPGYLDLLTDVRSIVLNEDNPSLWVPVYDFLTGVFLPDRRGDGRLDYNLIRGFWKYLRANPCDLLICHDQYAGLAGFYARKHLGVPYVVILHERLDIPFPRPFSVIADAFERRTLQNATRVVSSTEKIAESARRKYGLSVKTAYQGLVDRQGPPFGNRGASILAVSFWDRGRRPEVYLDLLELLPDYELYMVGNWRTDSEFQRFQAIASTHPARGRLKLRKGLSEEELNRLYQNSRFVVRFGFGEFGESHAVFEALENRTPVIINEDLGTSQLVRDFGVGHVINETDLVSARDFILSHANPSAFNQLQLQISKMIQEFSWLSHARILLGSITSPASEGPD